MWMQLLWQRAQEKNTVLINWSDGEGVEAQSTEPINWPHKQRTICKSPGLHLSLWELPSLRQAGCRTATKPFKPPHFDPAHRVPRCWSISGQLKQLLTTQTSCSYWVLNPDGSPTPCADSCRTFLSTIAANPDVCSRLPVRAADQCVVESKACSRLGSRDTACDEMKPEPLQVNIGRRPRLKASDTLTLHSEAGVVLTEKHNTQGMLRSRLSGSCRFLVSILIPWLNITAVFS